MDEASENAAEDDGSRTMTVEIRGVLRRHPWVGQVSVDHDLDEDVYSLAVKRAAAYGWSSAYLGPALGGRRWEHAGAGGDWSQDGAVRQLGRLTVYPAVDLSGQRLPVLPMTQVLVDALGRVGEVRFTGLGSRVPVGLAPDSGFDLRGDADWFALSDPAARTDIAVSVSPQSAVGAEQLAVEVARLSQGHVRLSPSSGPLTLQGTAPEWTPQAAAWITEIVIDVLRAKGVRTDAEITVALPTE
ncbi:hypothetical protein [Streptomyces sp. LaPpAH-108]|uniref:hypothetical protein n=1 Tax=Streptomyces sp. LaPpAH-108 TaxID=1155714 RepID=UPI000368F9F2|nr:hypothetical protein [Streptomyces sp. LaPpAH-108]